MNLDFEQPAADPQLWLLDPQVTFLNHGSFGACPVHVLEFQRELQDRLERQPVQFFVRDLESLLDEARATLAQFVGADAEDLVFVPNATAGVNTVLRSLKFQPGDELLVTDHEYNACRNALNFAAEQSGARAVIVPLPFPFSDPAQLTEAILARVTPRTRLALLDHVTSQTGVMLPLETLVPELQRRGVDVLVDGAHSPGMIPLNVNSLGAAFYTGNCHKWLCAPKGAAFLHVRRDRQKVIRPLVISHGANTPRTDRSRFLIEFGWAGTWDASAWLSVPEALRFVGGLLPGGWPHIMEHNHRLALAARKLICDTLGISSPCPDACLGSTASIPLPASASAAPSRPPLHADPLQEWLWKTHSVEVPVIPWPAPPQRLLRISCQLYNSLPQYRRLAEILAGKLRAA